MKGRTENELKEMKRMNEKLDNYPTYLREFYDSLDEKSYTTKRCYIDYVLDMLDGTTGKDNPDIEEVKRINTGELQRYMNSLKYMENGEKVGASIRAARWTAINSFFKFLVGYRYIGENPFGEYVQRPVIKNTKPVVYLDEKEIETLLQNVEEMGSGVFKIRDRAIIRLFITTGLRETALTEINIEDINFDEGSIWTTNKGEKSWKVYPGYRTMRAIEEWIDNRESLFRDGDEQTDALFISSYRTRITAAGIRKLVAKYTKDFDKHISPHKLRSTCATNMYKQTQDIMLVAETLGHSDVKVTKRYTTVEESTRKKAGEVMNSLV